jgi:chromosome segregation ATPase
MRETKIRGRKAETIEDLDASIEKMEAELAEDYDRPLNWEEATTTTAEELAAKEQRRSIVPRLITAAKIKRLELQRERWEREIEPLEVERDEAHERLEAAQTKLNEAERERNLAQGAWSHARGLIQSRQDRIREVNREIQRATGIKSMRSEEEREAGHAFGEMLRARLEAGRIKVKHLMAQDESADSPGTTRDSSSEPTGDNDAA